MIYYGTDERLLSVINAIADPEVKQIALSYIDETFDNLKKVIATEPTTTKKYAALRALLVQKAPVKQLQNVIAPYVQKTEQEIKAAGLAPIDPKTYKDIVKKIQQLQSKPKINPWFIIIPVAGVVGFVIYKQSKTKKGVKHYEI